MKRLGLVIIFILGCWSVVFALPDLPLVFTVWDVDTQGYGNPPVLAVSVPAPYMGDNFPNGAGMDLSMSENSSGTPLTWLGGYFDNGTLVSVWGCPNGTCLGYSSDTLGINWLLTDGGTEYRWTNAGWAGAPAGGSSMMSNFSLDIVSVEVLAGVLLIGLVLYFGLRKTVVAVSRS